MGLGSFGRPRRVVWAGSESTKGGESFSLRSGHPLGTVQAQSHPSEILRRPRSPSPLGAPRVHRTPDHADPNHED